MAERSWLLRMMEANPSRADEVAAGRSQTLLGSSSRAGAALAIGVRVPTLNFCRALIGRGAEQAELGGAQNSGSFCCSVASVEVGSSRSVLAAFALLQLRRRAYP